MKYEGKKGICKVFARYVSTNVLAMLGLSCYIIADTFFISKYAGADGVTVLNLCLPIYNLIFAVGSMIGTGSAIRYSVSKGSEGERRNMYFTNALLWTVMIGLAFAVFGAPNAGDVLKVMGGDARIVSKGTEYLRIVLAFAPCFTANYVFTSFVRNDGAPLLCMAATLISNAFNIVFDYVFMFAAGMGMAGAALATALAPLVSILCCSAHFFDRRNQIRFTAKLPSFKLLAHSCAVGVSAFVDEMSAGVTTTVFNFLILNLEGNVGVAAYGIIANLAIVGTAIFNGIARGTQPIISGGCAEGNRESVGRICVMGAVTAFAVAALMYAGVWAFTERLVEMFNSENSVRMSVLAFKGLRIYCVGFFFSGLNIFFASSMSAQEQGFSAAVIAFSRGLAAITLCAVVLSMIGGMTGIWAAYPAAEAITLLAAAVLMRRERGRKVQ